MIIPPTIEMISFIQGKLGVEEARRRIESVRYADQVSVAKAIWYVYKSLRNS